MKAEQKETHIRLQETVRCINGRHQLSEEHHDEDNQRCLKNNEIKKGKSSKARAIEIPL